MLELQQDPNNQCPLRHLLLGSVPVSYFHLRYYILSITTLLKRVGFRYLRAPE